MNKMDATTAMIDDFLYIWDPASSNPDYENSDLVMPMMFAGVNTA